MVQQCEVKLSTEVHVHIHNIVVHGVNGVGWVRARARVRVRLRARVGVI